MASVTGSTDSAVLTFWGDVGVVGFLLFLGLYIIPFLKCLKILREKNVSRQKQVIAEALIGILVMFLLINIVLDVIFIIFLTVWIWILIAFLYLPDENIEAEKTLLK